MTTLISEEYRLLNAKLHVSNEQFGKRGNLSAMAAMSWCAQLQTNDVLDYGCGKGELNLHMPFHVQCYDPAVAKFAGSPEPADIVVCSDVLEHVEPEYLQNVLDDLVRVVKRVGMFVIALKPAMKHLEDGRNAHLSLHPKEWWQEQLEARFDLIDTEDSDKGNSWGCIVVPKGSMPDAQSA